MLFYLLRKEFLDTMKDFPGVEIKTKIARKV